MVILKTLRKVCPHQEVTILFSLTRWMESVLYSQMFYLKVQFESLDGNIANII